MVQTGSNLVHDPQQIKSPLFGRRFLLDKFIIKVYNI